MMTTTRKWMDLDLVNGKCWKYIYKKDFQDMYYDYKYKFTDLFKWDYANTVPYCSKVLFHEKVYPRFFFKS